MAHGKLWSAVIECYLLQQTTQDVCNLTLYNPWDPDVAI
jgi:hypothetical protein